MITAALLGNPNVGKTTLFNALTGSNQHVGKWGGVTVDKKEGIINNKIKIVDLPGIYAMDTYSNEEKVSKEFLENGNVDVIINIVDASSLERNLYLTTQLKQFNIPIILVLNMVDVAISRGLGIDYNLLSDKLGLKIIPIVASKGKGISEITDCIIKKDYITTTPNSLKFKDEKETYGYIESLLKSCTNKSNDSKTSITEIIDKIVLNRYMAYPLFFGSLFLIFMFTFNWVGQPLAYFLNTLLNDSFVPFLSNVLASNSSWFSSLIIDGIVGGVGSVVVFLPVILALFLGISFLEDSGYMARAAFIMDKLMRKMGLSGK
ncbi:MAG: ferrous iron transporter B, partial [Clostridiaceae bacterium]|nr:ferrous iron transporter B [Clostridiaceae bacterium]